MLNGKSRIYTSNYIHCVIALSDTYTYIHTYIQIVPVKQNKVCSRMGGLGKYKGLGYIGSPGLGALEMGGAYLTQKNLIKLQI